MRNYQFRIPLVKVTTTPFLLCGTNGQQVGTIERFFTTKGQKMFSLLFTSWFNHVRVVDANGRVRVEATQVHNFRTLVQSQWKVSRYDQEETYEFYAKQATVVKTNPRMIYNNGKQEMIISRDLGDKRVRFTDRESQQLVAEGFYKSIVPPKFLDMTLQVYSDESDEFETVCLYYLFALTN